MLKGSASWKQSDSARFRSCLSVSVGEARFEVRWWYMVSRPLMCIGLRYTFDSEGQHRKCEGISIGYVTDAYELEFKFIESGRRSFLMRPKKSSYFSRKALRPG